MEEGGSLLSTVDSNSPIHSPAKQVLRNFIFIFLIVLAAGLTSRFAATNLDETFITQNRWIKLRIKGALDFLNSHESKNSIYVWGTSEVESGLRPQQLEKEICPGGTKTPKVFNLGFRDFNPFQMQLFLKHWKFPKKLPLINIVKINPVHLTKPSYKRMHKAVDEVWEDLATPKEIIFGSQWTITNRLNMLWAKILLAGVAPGSLQLRLVRDSLVVYRNEESVDRKSLWGDSKTHPIPAWDLSLQGFHDRSKGVGSSEEYVKELKLKQSQEPELSSSFRYHYAKTGLNSPEFHSRLRTAYIQWIRELKLRSENLILFYTPEHPLARTLKTKKRFSAFLKKVSNITGVPVIDFSDYPKFQSSEYYYDTHHFTEKGEEEFIHILSGLVKDQLSPEQLNQFCSASD